MRRLLLPHLIRRAVKSASSLIAPSVATREDLQGWFSDLSPTVHVIPEAPAEHFRPSADHEVDRVRKRYALHEPFVLFVGSKRRHKRIDHLIDAWGSLDQELTSHRTLVLAGAESNDSAALRELVTAHGLEQSVRFLGRIPEPDLAPLYSAAELFVLPSLFEGFGLTMVEAMACATPVLCSNSSSLAEISGEAALLFDPKLPGSLTQQLVRLLSSAALRRELAEAAFQRAQSFSWHRAAENTLQVLIEAAQSRSRAGR